MSKKLAVVLFLGFLIIFFRDSMVWAGVKIKPTQVSKEQLIKEAGSLRKNLLVLFENHKQAEIALVSALSIAKREQILSEDFLQSEMEKILETQSMFFWNKREVTRKNFLKMPFKELQKEIYGMRKAIEAVDNATAFFAERTFLLKKVTESASSESEKDCRGADKKIFRNILGIKLGS
ncbi:MAG: hypothetical protein Q7S18_03560 [bacterium]|nr:hypothetical protein [bacterium]